MTLLFAYEARSGSGKIERGSIQARDREQALTRLYQRDLTPVSLKPATNVSRRATLDDKTAHEVSRTLAQMLRAGLSFSQALRFASEELSPAAAHAAGRMREAAELGAPISSALDDFSGPQARLLAGVMRAGETSGRLADALDMAAASFGRSAALRSRMGSALIYPSFVIVATLVTLSLFMLLVVPTIAQAFDGAEDRLPPSTRSLLALSHWLQQNGLYLALGVVVALAICITNTDVKRLVGQSVDAALASPLALGVVQRLEYAAFSSLAALSLEAGVPSAAAFEAAAAGVRNEPIRRKLESAVRAIRTGERPSHAVERYASPPRSFSRLMLVGEETGRMPQALKQAGDLLSNEAEQRLERLGAIAGPIVTLGLGGLVASVVASLFLGLLSLSDFATS